MWGRDGGLAEGPEEVQEEQILQENKDGLLVLIWGSFCAGRVCLRGWGGEP